MSAIPSVSSEHTWSMRKPLSSVLHGQKQKADPRHSVLNEAKRSEQASRLEEKQARIRTPRESANAAKAGPFAQEVSSNPRETANALRVSPEAINDLREARREAERPAEEPTPARERRVDVYV
ncbi:hypothetical protein SIID45300_03298 [Candidatus Magnetaquicoccaceae bacterium FCR-1]|uniref:Uncharacterized protein n=1 Tax=Candidatus Magnetaquiglobus chichijimensis TaxID=3141448 RepID=A0ABQ0CDG0_9PROT